MKHIVRITKLRTGDVHIGYRGTKRVTTKVVDRGTCNEPNKTVREVFTIKGWQLPSKNMPTACEYTTDEAQGIIKGLYTMYNEQYIMEEVL